MNSLRRAIAHLTVSPWQVRHKFPNLLLKEIEESITLGEKRHHGQVRFIVESALPFKRILQDYSPRQRAIDLFSEFRVWDTEKNCGVLIYVLFADKTVEIIADRGITKLVAPAQWLEIAEEMQQSFRQGKFSAGVLQGIQTVHQLLQQHFPKDYCPETNDNELSDQPIVLT